MNALRDKLYTVIRYTERISIERLAERFNQSETTIELHIKRLISENYPLKIKNGWVINGDHGFARKIIESGSLFRNVKGKRWKH
jgi:DeoR/GlpR family transcriptional regulator of sugar metabolism